ncbi:MAG: DUF1801 domain-containing protein [Bacteroidota bacterium]|nr:DUF1801 domain-containing protein [Bacteroidota bacterium]MDX5429066.1 DUF1801 domain-containing protein [Bacteroidota bacterium]MDX5448874.1 DUF1801 domain-containing protein [Bacteroidota bacterium]MDX5506723.1 DUF1801 domain-containing protein [Bacteroidota bacterium]
MTPEDYLLALPEERQTPMRQLRKVILDRLPDQFEEEMSYGMIGYVVPHSVYPSGYHCDPKLPLPFMSIASQKSHIGFYHMGLYADESLMKWFQQEFPKHSSRKLDMGKSCVRFKNPEHIPYELIGDLVSRMTAEEWIQIYEDKFKR